MLLPASVGGPEGPQPVHRRGERPLLDGDLLPELRGDAAAARSSRPTAGRSPTAPRCCPGRATRASTRSRRAQGPVGLALRLHPARPARGPAQRALHRVAAADEDPARHVPVRQPAGLLPAVQRRDGAAAAHGRRAGARRVGVRPGGYDRKRKRVRRARPRRPLVGRGVLPGIRLGAVRPDAIGCAGELAGERGRAPARRRATSATRAGRATAARTRTRAAASGADSSPFKLPLIVALVFVLLVLGDRAPRAAPADRAAGRRPGPRRARARAAPVRPDARQRGDALAAGDRARRQRRRAGVPARGPRAPLRRRGRAAADARAAPRAAAGAERRARAVRTATRRGGPFRRVSYTRRRGRRLRALLQRDAPSGAGRLPCGSDPAEPRARPGARQGLDPRGARPRAVRRPALRGGRRRVRRDRRAARRPTTTRSSAWAARCSSSGATPRRAAR